MLWVGCGAMTWPRRMANGAPRDVYWTARATGSEKRGGFKWRSAQARLIATAPHADSSCDWLLLRTQAEFIGFYCLLPFTAYALRNYFLRNSLQRFIAKKNLHCNRVN